MTTTSLHAALSAAVAEANGLGGGAPASYIPELANVDPEQLSAAIMTIGGEQVLAGDAAHRFTLQSSAKLLLLAGLLEEQGHDEVFATVGAEPTGGAFSSVAWLEQHGPKPANPLVNAGAIALCARLGGNLEDRLAWIERWAARLYGCPVAINPRVMLSERRTGHRNRAIAWFLKGAGMQGDVDEILEVYFALCSLESGVAACSRMAAVLAGGGRSPGKGEVVVSERTARDVVAIMATCGMYDESGAHLLRTGLPAKSGVSGVIVAVAPGRAGIAVASPRVNDKGGSVRGHAVLTALARDPGWHFALP